jgi:hypothetical protein
MKFRLFGSEPSVTLAVRDIHFLAYGQVFCCLVNSSVVENNAPRLQGALGLGGILGGFLRLFKFLRRLKSGRQSQINRLNRRIGLRDRPRHKELAGQVSSLSWSQNFLGRGEPKRFLSMVRPANGAIDKDVRDREAGNIFRRESRHTGQIAAGIVPSGKRDFDHRISQPILEHLAGLTLRRRRGQQNRKHESVHTNTILPNAQKFRRIMEINSV